MTDEVLFDEPTHTYTVNGVFYPSVSEVLSLFADFARVPKHLLEFKRMVGRATHRAIEYYESGLLDMDSVDESVLPFLQSWVAFRTIKPLRVVAAERIVYSKKHRVAGRLDLIVDFEDEPGILWVLDAKCVHTMDPATALQTAGYKESWNENEELKVKKRAGLQLKGDGSMAELYPYDGIDHKNDFLLFLNALNLNRWLRNHGK